ncbi:MAG: hypothetical protein ACFE95_06950 [Candidatus Hodarchaeota archaeon]
MDKSTNDTRSKSSSDFLQQQAIQHFQNRIKIEKIAEFLGVSRKRIIHCLPEDLITKRIEELVKQGLGFYQIGEIIGISGKTVIHCAKRANIDTLHTSRIIQMFQNGTPIKTIAKELNMNTQKVIAEIPNSLRYETLKKFYIVQELPYNDIIAKLGISRTSLKNWLHKYNLMNRHPNAEIEFKEYPKRKIIGDYLRLKSVDSIAKIRKFPVTTVKRILDEAGVKRYNTLALIRKHVDNYYNIPINSYLNEVITGELLGDGNISFARKTAIRQISKTKYLKAVNTLQGFRSQISVDIESDVKKFNNAIEVINDYRVARINFVMSLLAIPWAIHIRNIFERNSVPMSFKINDASLMVAKYHTVGVWSRSTMQFRELQEQWYPKGEKIISRKIKISPTSLLHWFIGDGSSSDSALQFSTHNFSITEVNFLVDLLNKSLNIRSRCGIDYQTQPVLKVYRNEDVKTIYEYLELANPKSLSLAKEIFPWKFDPHLRKRDIMMSEWYPEVLCSFVKKESKNVCTLIKRVINQYYFKSS